MVARKPQIRPTHLHLADGRVNTQQLVPEKANCSLLHYRMMDCLRKHTNYGGDHQTLHLSLGSEGTQHHLAQGWCDIHVAENSLTRCLTSQRLAEAQHCLRYGGPEQTPGLQLTSDLDREID